MAMCSALPALTSTAYATWWATLSICTPSTPGILPWLCLGEDFADQGLTIIQESNINDGDTWLLGGAEAFAGGEGTYDQFFGTIMEEAALEAGIRDPNRLSRVYQDPTVQRILAEGAQGDWSDERIQAEIRNTDIYYDIYPGIDKILASGSVDPEAEWRTYYNSVEDGLRVLGYETDEFGNYDAQVGDMLEKGIDSDDFTAFVPTFVRAEQSPEFMASLNAWTQNDLGVDITFEDWFDVLDGNPAPEIGEVVEKAIIQYQAEQGFHYTVTGSDRSPRYAHSSCRRGRSLRRSVLLRSSCCLCLALT